MPWAAQGWGEAPECWCLQQGMGQGLRWHRETLEQGNQRFLLLPFLSYSVPDGEVCKRHELLGATGTEITCNPSKPLHFPKWP